MGALAKCPPSSCWSLRECGPLPGKEGPCLGRPPAQIARCLVGHADPDVFVPVRQRVDAVLQYPALGVEGGKCCLVEMHREDLVVYSSKHVHPVLIGLLAEEGVLVVLVADIFLRDNLLGALCFPFVFAALDFDRVHLGAQEDGLRDWFSAALVLHLAEDFLVLQAVEGMVFGVVARVVELEVAPHVFVDILRLDLEEERVRVRVEQLAASSVLLLEVLVVELVHQ